MYSTGERVRNIQPAERCSVQFRQTSRPGRCDYVIKFTLGERRTHPARAMEARGPVHAKHPVQPHSIADTTPRGETAFTSSAP